MHTPENDKESPFLPLLLSLMTSRNVMGSCFRQMNIFYRGSVRPHSICQFWQCRFIFSVNRFFAGRKLDFFKAENKKKAYPHILAICGNRPAIPPTVLSQWE
jgi:hypothetical protein